MANCYTHLGYCSYMFIYIEHFHIQLMVTGTHHEWFARYSQLPFLLCVISKIAYQIAYFWLSSWISLVLAVFKAQTLITIFASSFQTATDHILFLIYGISEMSHKSMKWDIMRAVLLLVVTAGRQAALKLHFDSNIYWRPKKAIVSSSSRKAGQNVSNWVTSNA